MFNFSNSDRRTTFSIVRVQVRPAGLEDLGADILIDGSTGKAFTAIEEAAHTLLDEKKVYWIMLNAEAGSAVDCELMENDGFAQEIGADLLALARLDDRGEDTFNVLFRTDSGKEPNTPDGPGEYYCETTLLGRLASDNRLEQALEQS